MRTAVVCIAKNEDRYIKEWAEYHLKLGFTSVYINQNNWRCDLEMPNVFKGIIDGKARQIACYNKFLRKQKSYDWVAFIDVDEFIVLSKHSNITEFIEWMLATHGPTEAMVLYWTFFGDNGIKEDDGSKGTLKRFTKRGESNRHYKSIINGKIKNARFINPHEGNKPAKDISGKAPVRMSVPNIAGSYPVDVAKINHYYSKTRKEFEKKVARGRADVTHKRKSSNAEFEKSQKNQNIFDDFEARNFMYPPNNDTV